jgi:nucleoside-diphosphate-sugar epimerase
MQGKNTVLILGGTGRFGQAAIHAFHLAGWQVIAQSRAQPSCRVEGVTYLHDSIFDTTAIVHAAKNAAVVVHALNPAYTQWHKQALPLCHAGMNIAEQLNALFMLPGNVYNYGETMPAILHPDTPQRPTARKGLIRCDMENEMAQRAQRTQQVTSGGGLRSVVIRAGDFFGGGTGNWFDLVIVKSAAKGKLVYPGPLNTMHAWAYLPDLANVFELVAQRSLQQSSTPKFERHHFAGYSLTGEELLVALETALNIARRANAQIEINYRRGTLPWGFIKIAGIVVPSWRELSEMAYLWTSPHQLSDATLVAKIGAVPATPLNTAITNALALLKPPHSKR